MQGLFRKLETTVVGGAVVIATASLASRFLGLLRDRLLFSTFGAGDTLDSYYVAFRLPDLIFNILILGALSSSFIPVFVEYRQRAEGEEGRQEAWRLANGVLSIILLVLSVLAILGFLLAPLLVPIFAPGFSGAKLHDTIALTRIMLLAILFFGASNIVGSMLNAMRRFVAFAIAPILYNAGIIVGILVFYPALGLPGLAWGVVFGAFLHLLTQLPSILRQGYRFRWMLLWRNAGVRKIFRLMLPRTIGLSAVQLDQLVSTMIASTLAIGSVAIFSAAQNLQSFPINIIGVSLAISSFPVFSEAFARKRTDEFVKEFSKVFRRILFTIIPLSVLILLLRAHIVRIVLGAGKFNWSDTILTAQSLGFFSLSLFAQSLTPMLARSFYAFHDTSTPARISVFSVVIDIIGCLWLSRLYGVMGLALSFAIASALQMVLLLVFLRLRIGDLDDSRILNSTIKIVVGSGVMAAAVWLSLQFFALGIDQRTFFGVLFQGIGAAVIGGVVYLLVALALHFQEVELVAGWLRRVRTVLLNGRRKES
ncbi:MAG: murein biosynthesis integral membrane protein MurJ [bacterium]